ncbi:hypothetical protein FRC16_004446 [Serendipita sp. 398]|nr:hypothetical protein FRC16_004446 [Serendipita sp. 398]
MRFASILFSLASATLALAAPYANYTRGCHNTVSAAQASVIESQFAQDFAAAGLVDSLGDTQRAGNIQVYWHVVYKSTSVSGGYISDSAISSSIRDYVSDTPPQSTATSGCPSSQDSCSGGGVDSIHNYMDYSTDACMTSFTTGQITRATSQSATYRGL